MRSMISNPLAALVAVACSASVWWPSVAVASSYSSTSDDGATRYEVTPVFEPTPWSGYAAYQLSTRGVGADESMRVDASTTVRQYYYRRTEFTMKSETEIADPSSPQWLVVPTDNGRWDTSSSSHSSGSAGDVDLMLNHRGSTAWVSTYSHSGSSSVNNQLAYSRQLALDHDVDLDRLMVFDAHLLPADWRALSGVEALTMTADEWMALDVATRYAIFDYVRMGGRLDVVTPDEGGATPAQLGLSMIDPGKRTGVAGLGQVELIAEPDFEYNESARSSLPKMAHAEPPLQSRIPDSKKPGPLTLIGVLGLGALIGPVNLFVITRKRRHRLFFTIPLIALAASIVFAVAIFVADGVGGDGERFAIVAISPETSRASVFQQQSSRCGAMLGTSFETDEPTLIVDNGSLSGMMDSSYRRRGNRGASNVRLQVNGGTQFSGDWFKSREKQVHTVVTAIPSRSRLALVDGNDVTPETPPATRTIANTTGSTLDWVGFVDHNDNAYVHEGAIAPGAQVTLAKCTPAKLRNKVAAATKGKLKGDVVTSTLRNLLGHGQIVAIANDAPELCVATHESIDWAESPAIILQPAITE